MAPHGADIQVACRQQVLDAEGCDLRGLVEGDLGVEVAARGVPAPDGGHPRRGVAGSGPRLPQAPLRSLDACAQGHDSGAPLGVEQGHLRHGGPLGHLLGQGEEGHDTQGGGRSHLEVVAVVDVLHALSQGAHRGSPLGQPPLAEDPHDVGAAVYGGVVLLGKVRRQELARDHQRLGEEGHHEAPLGQAPAHLVEVFPVRVHGDAAPHPPGELAVRAVAVAAGGEEVEGQEEGEDASHPGSGRSRTAW